METKDLATEMGSVSVQLLDPSRTSSQPLAPSQVGLPTLRPRKSATTRSSVSGSENDSRLAADIAGDTVLRENMSAA